MKGYSEIQEEILSEVPNGYKLQGYCHNHNLTLKSFVFLFLKVLKNKHYTISNNPVSNYIVCDTHKRRTLHDIFLICRHYYPHCTLKEVHRELLLLDTVECVLCQDIKKHAYRISPYGIPNRTSLIGEYGYPCEQFLD